MEILRGRKAASMVRHLPIVRRAWQIARRFGSRQRWPSWLSANRPSARRQGPAAPAAEIFDNRAAVEDNSSQRLERVSGASFGSTTVLERRFGVKADPDAVKWRWCSKHPNGGSVADQAQRAWLVVRCATSVCARPRSRTASSPLCRHAARASDSRLSSPGRRAVRNGYWCEHLRHPMITLKPCDCCQARGATARAARGR